MALLKGMNCIRDTQAIPKTARAQCLLTEAPSPVATAELAELGIKLAAP